jgi:hypothetical protein
MKKIISLFLISIALFLVQPVNAHLSNQTPFFKINGQFTPLYPISPDYNTNITLPQDMGFENYLVNQELSFELDQNNIPVAPGILDVVVFRWDFGDGTLAEGLQAKHQYNSPGSYLITIHAVYGNEAPQLVQSTLVNVLSDKNYQLPQAVIQINGKPVVNDPKKPIKVLLNQSIELDGISSKASGKIIKYEWDLDNNDLQEGATVRINYNNSFNRVYPALKITDEYGFIYYAIVALERADQNLLTEMWFKISDWANENQQVIELGLTGAPLLFIGPIAALIGFDWFKRKRYSKK